MTPEETADRFDNRAGYRVIAYGTVGLPLYRLTSLALCLAKKSLDPIEEFILRSVMAGADRLDQVAALLGLHSSVIESCMVDLIRKECLQVPPNGATDRQHIELTTKGSNLARDEEATVPVEQTIVFFVDGLTRAPRFYPSEVLHRPRDLKNQGIPEVRAFPARAPTLDEVDIKDVIDVVRLDAGRAESPRQLLRINSIERRDRVFLEAVALAYRAESGGALQVAFAIDGRLSSEHEAAFARAKGPEKAKIFRGIHEPSVPPPMVEVMGDALSKQVERAAQAQGDADKLRREARVGRASLEAQDHTDQARQAAAGVAKDVGKKLHAIEAQLQSLEVRPLAVYEHPRLLRSAFEQAEERVLVISPWIRRAVVTRAFVKTIRQALDRGVRVYVGYGLGESDKNENRSDVDAREELERLAAVRRPFVLRRLGDTHAKILIMDRSFFVISSFNWLSFRGNPHQTFREEWGTLVTIPSVVEEYFQQMVKRFAADECGC